MKSEAFKAINENQKVLMNLAILINDIMLLLQVNHFPGSFQLGRKDRLWRNMFRMQARYGRKVSHVCCIITNMIIINQDYKLLVIITNIIIINQDY